MKIIIVIILFFFCFVEIKSQTINQNQSRETWVLVWNDTTKQIILIIEPNHKTTTIYQLKEFNTEQELNEFIEINQLIRRKEDL